MNAAAAFSALTTRSRTFPFRQITLLREGHVRGDEIGGSSGMFKCRSLYFPVSCGIPDAIRPQDLRHFDVNAQTSASERGTPLSPNPDARN
jgi:hypothetical protein